MDLTPELLTDEVQFRMAFRGYDSHQVDAFLERVANALQLLQGRLARATEEAEAAQRRSEEVEAAADRQREALADEMAALRQARDSLRSDVELLERHLDERRQAVLATLDDVRALLEHPERMRIGSPVGHVEESDPNPTPTGSDHAALGWAPTTGPEEPERLDATGGGPATPAAPGGERDAAVPGSEARSEHTTPPAPGVVDSGWGAADPADDGGFDDAIGRQEAWASAWADDGGNGEGGDGADGSRHPDPGPASRLQWRFDVAADEEQEVGGGRAGTGGPGYVERWEQFEDDLAAEGGEHPDFWRNAGALLGPGEPAARPELDDEDAFLAELRQAMAEGEGVEAHGGGPDDAHGPGSSLTDSAGRPRRGFGRRR